MTGELVTAPDGSSVKYVQAVPFAVVLDLETIALAARSLTPAAEREK